MTALRRALYAHAGAWAVIGVALAVAPRFVLVTVFRQPEPQEPAWLRLLGTQAFGLALLMVLVAHRADEVWWWSWAFALATVGVAVVAILHLAFGLASGQSPALWSAVAVVSAGFSAWLLYGLYLTGRHFEPG